MKTTSLPERSATVCEPRWFVGVVDRLQVALDVWQQDNADWDPSSLGAASQLVERAARTPADRLMLRGLALDFGLKFARSVHRARSGDDTCDCLRGSLASLCSATVVEPGLERLQCWTSEVVSMVWRRHPLCPAECLAREIRRAPAARSLITTVAQRCHCSPRGLGLDFRSRFAMRPLEFARLCRVQQAIPGILDGDKIEAAALAAGFRHRKGFYQAFGLAFQRTPVAFRRASPAVRAALLAELSQRLCMRPPPLRPNDLGVDTGLSIHL